MVGARSQSVATGWWDTSVAGKSGARENSPGLKADGLGSVGGPVKSRWEGNAPTDYSRRVALPETARRDDHSVAPGATDRARLGLVTKRCLEVPPECMQGGSLWPGRALERQRSAAHDPCCAGGWGSRLSDQHST